MTRPQIQSTIPGTESDEDKIQTPELTARVHAWLDAQEAQRRASLETKTIHALMIAELTLANVKRYPYLDRKTGHKRYVTVAAEPKAKTIKAPTAKQEGRKARAAERAAEKAKEKREADKAESVEHRKVSRTPEHDAITKPKPLAIVEDVDPFAATRAAMEGNAP
jgi:hypothetical protein